MSTQAALDNAKTRAQAGWPLVLIAVAAYSPLGGLPRLFLIGLGLVFLAQHHPGHPAPAKAAAAKPANRPAKKTPARKQAPAKTTQRPNTGRRKVT